MFHVPATALLLTILVCAAVHLGLHLWSKLRGVQISRVWYLFPPVLALPLWVVLSLALQDHWRHQGKLESGQDWPYSEDSIPYEARDVDIDADYNTRHAKFRIESGVLLSWCEQKKAKVERLGGKFPQYRYVFDAERHDYREIEITEGFAASDRWPNGGGFSIIYDSTEGIAYYHWSTH